jgi:hypothetical protein
MKYFFLRNDDVRSTLDTELVELVELCKEFEVPISLTVEPANVSDEVVNWLMEEKEKHPGIIEIVQHGYDHKLKYSKMIGGKMKKGEFGGDRTYDDQYKDIEEGKQLMDKYFGDKWFKLFTFPFGARNDASIKAVNDAGFLAVNGSMGITWKHKMFYLAGRKLNKELLKGRKISYHLRYKRGTKLFQIDTSISIIKKFIDSDKNGVFYNLEDLIDVTKKYLQETSAVGVVLHHRYHHEQETKDLMRSYFEWLKSQDDITCVTQKQIFEKYA